MAITRVAFSLIIALAATELGYAAGPDAKDLRRGLVATFKGSGRGQVVEVTQLEPTIALALKEDDAPHPRLPANALTVVWKGYVHVSHAGGYRFGVRLRGDFHLTIAGKEMLSARSN